MKCSEWLLFMKTVSHVVLSTNHNTGFKFSVINQVAGFKTLCYGQLKIIVYCCTEHSFQSAFSGRKHPFFEICTVQKYAIIIIFLKKKKFQKN